MHVKNMYMHIKNMHVTTNIEVPNYGKIDGFMPIKTPICIENAIKIKTC